MTRKGEAHETLSLLFYCDSVPPTMVLDGLKEQTKGGFKRKLREADCHAKQTEPYSPWQQAAEGCIHKLECGVSSKMIKTGSPPGHYETIALNLKCLSAHQPVTMFT
jgi:hypothetical protein